MSDAGFPFYANEFTAELLTQLIAQRYPGSVVDSFTVVEGRQYGDGNASTAGRCVFEVRYAPGSASELPSRIAIKIARVGASPDHYVLYRNELQFYERLRSSLTIETPQFYGSHLDEQAGTFALVMDDLQLRGVQFMNNQVPHTPDHVRLVLDVLATLHAKYWQSPALTGDLAWVHPHISGPLHEVFADRNRVPALIAAVISQRHFKQEMLQRMGVTPDDLYAQTMRAQQHQATLPQTLLHGDSHVGNTYRVERDGKLAGGLIDWQLIARGHYMHDVGYYIQTALCVGDRRKHERELIQHYLERLRQAGVTSPPDFNSAWLEYRRTCPWNIYVGWLAVDVANYGWEICELAHLRVMTAYEDLESAKAMAVLN